MMTAECVHHDLLSLHMVTLLSVCTVTLLKVYMVDLLSAAR